MSEPAQLRIGLFGGSFNPVHLGHLLVAQAALEELTLHRLVFVPAAQSPFKPHLTLAPPAARLQMLRLALAGRARFEIDPQEIQRGGVSYTVDTLRDYRRRFPQAELYYLIGADHAPLLPKWRSADELAALAEFVIIPRPTQPATSVAPPFRCRQLSGFPLALSSSQVRERVQAGQPIDLLVGAAVAEAVRNNGLYL